MRVALQSLRHSARLGVMCTLTLICWFGQARAASKASSTVVPHWLRCDDRVNPLGITPDTARFSWQLRLTEPGIRDVAQIAYRILVSKSRGGLEGQTPFWDSGKVTTGETFGHAYAGPPLEPHTRYWWKAAVWDNRNAESSWSEPASFATGLLQESDWKARWISAEPDRASRTTIEGQEELTKEPKPLPLFRYGFRTSQAVTEALLYVSGLGQYEVHINGRTITEDVLTPGWTDYRKRVFYNSYDVTAAMRAGANAIGVMLGNGMYNVEGVAGRYSKFVGSYGQPKLILQLHLLFPDGREQVIASDATWKTMPGPIVFSSVYGGEDFDARREPAGWDTNAFSDVSWRPVLVVSGPGGLLRAESTQPVRSEQELRPLQVTQPLPHRTVYDLGRNFAGWPDIAVRGPAGSSVTLVAGELLTSEGSVTQASAHAFADSQNSFTYTLKGTGVEHWHPRFSYYGFRYVEARLLPSAAPPQIITLKGVSLHAHVPVDGGFQTSDKLFRNIHELINGAILSNMVSVLTDCPHREKLGWLEQTHLAAASIMNNYDVSLLYRKISDDMQDDQLANGLVPSIAPEFVAFVHADGESTAFRDSPEWGSAVILSPWAVYRMYGDVALLRSHYTSMKRYVDYLKSHTQDHVLSYGLGDWYDIGPGAPGESKLTGKGLTATATYYEDLAAMSHIAVLLVQPEDAAAFTAEAAVVKASFNTHLFHPDLGQYDKGSQTAQAMPLVTGLVPEEQRSRVLDALVNDIRAHGNHVTAGDIGFHYVVRALSEAGRSDVLYDMLSQRDSPSYGYQLSRGATTLTEAWDSNPESSQNHFMLGHGEEWFYRGLAGIRIDFAEPGDRRIHFAPSPVGDIHETSASLRTQSGTVESAWVRTGASLRWHVSVPPGAVATITFPVGFGSDIRENGKPLASVPGIHSAAGRECVAGSGDYEFLLQ